MITETSFIMKDAFMSVIHYMIYALIFHRFTVWLAKIRDH